MFSIMQVLKRNNCTNIILFVEIYKKKGNVAKYALYDVGKWFVVLCVQTLTIYIYKNMDLD